MDVSLGIVVAHLIAYAEYFIFRAFIGISNWLFIQIPYTVVFDTVASPLWAH
jgi:hypothetical protein